MSLGNKNVKSFLAHILVKSGPIYVKSRTKWSPANFTHVVKYISSAEMLHFCNYPGEPRVAAANWPCTCDLHWLWHCSIITRDFLLMTLYNCVSFLFYIVSVMVALVCELNKTCVIAHDLKYSPSVRNSCRSTYRNNCLAAIGPIGLGGPRVPSQSR